MNPELKNAYKKAFAGRCWALWVFQFAQMAVFARVAGPEAAGDYALAAFISFITPVAEAGLSQAVVQAPDSSEAIGGAGRWVNMDFLACLMAYWPHTCRMV